MIITSIWGGGWPGTAATDSAGIARLCFWQLSLFRFGVVGLKSFFFFFFSWFLFFLIMYFLFFLIRLARGSILPNAV